MTEKLKEKAMRFWRIVAERYNNREGIKNPLENLSFWKKDYEFTSDELEQIFELLSKGIEEGDKIYKLENRNERYFAVLEEKEEENEKSKEKKKVQTPFVVIDDALYQQIW
jgi:murein L,D-transpeptidase YafK